MMSSPFYCWARPVTCDKVRPDGLDNQWKDVASGQNYQYSVTMVQVEAAPLGYSRVTT
jgi:hypothetical protein